MTELSSAETIAWVELCMQIFFVYTMSMFIFSVWWLFHQSKSESDELDEYF